MYAPTANDFIRMNFWVLIIKQKKKAYSFAHTHALWILNRHNNEELCDTIILH